MAKKAYLVDFSIRTRVIADLDNESADDLIDRAVDRLCDNPFDYLSADNLDKWQDDVNMPYDPNDFDKGV